MAPQPNYWRGHGPPAPPPYRAPHAGRAAAPPSPLLAVPNVTAHRSTASVPITVLLYGGPLLCGFIVAMKGLILYQRTERNAANILSCCHDYSHVLVKQEPAARAYLLPLALAYKRNEAKPTITETTQNGQRQAQQTSSNVTNSSLSAIAWTTSAQLF